MHLLPLLLLACPTPIGRACTEIGCEDQVEVRVLDPDGAPVTAFDGVIGWPDASPTSFTCPGATEIWCTDQGFWVATATEHFQLTLTSSDGTLHYDEDVVPAYTSTFPNGEDCPPECLQADLSVTLQPVAE